MGESTSWDQALEDIIRKRGNGSLVAILQEIQDRYNYLPEAALLMVSEKLNVPLSKLFSLATFYRSFSLVQRGRNILQICLGTACHVKGGVNLWEKVKRDLLLTEEERTTSDLRFTIEKVRCLGCCSLAPVVRINGDTYGTVTQEKLSEIVSRYG